MLLAVDVGNTQTHIGCFGGDSLRHSWRLATRAEATRDEFGLMLGGLLDSRGIGFDQIDGMIVSTVVPQLGSAYMQMAERYPRCRCLLVGAGMRTGMPIRIDNPRELGSDRLVNAVAAYERYDAACLAVDFGTSINFDAVSAQGEYMGGAIGPGLEVSMAALSGRTAKLPSIDFADVGTAIGSNTVAAIRSGFVFGFAGLVDGVARRVVAELGSPASVVATGGLAPVIAPHCETIDEVDEELTLTGLRLVWERNA
jgi:type III pantothenate kinase